MKNIEEVTISLCDNGFMLQFSYQDDRNDYQSKRMVFTHTNELYAYLDMLFEARINNGNPGF